MTRINVVPVECLSSTHCLAEFKEITRPFNKVLVRIKKGTMGDVIIPDNYCLGTGHETFFFDKLMWLHTRYLQLFEELLIRGFNLNEDQFMDISSDFEFKLGDTPYWNWYKPTPEDMYLNMARLVKRSKMDNVLTEMRSDT